MLTLLLVAFVSTMRVERLSSKAFTDQLKARLVADMATEQAIFQISQITSSNMEYITFVSNYTDGAGLTNPVIHFIVPGVTSLGLTTNFFSPSALLDGSNNFNVQEHMFPTGLVSSLRVPWTYYTNGFATNWAQQGRAISRYAWWFDDESSKINLNDAGNTNSPSGSHQRTNLLDASSFNVSAIDLRVFPGIGNVLAKEIVTNRVPPYETVATLLEIGGISYSNEFHGVNPVGNVPHAGMRGWGTVYSADYEFQTSGWQRLNINGKRYTTNNPAGPDNGLAATAVTNLVEDMGNSTKGIPLFTSKFGNTITQLCANIRDQLDADQLPTDSESNPYSLSGYLGIENVPYLNEFAMDTGVTIQQVDSNFVVSVTNTVIWEFFNLWKTPYTFNTNVAVAAGIPTVTFSWNGPNAGTTNLGSTNLAVVFLGVSMPAYSYRAVTNDIHGLSFNILTNEATLILTTTMDASGTITNLWGITNAGIYYRLDYAEVPLRPAQSPSNPRTDSLTEGMALLSFSNTHQQVINAPGDPRVNDTISNWKGGEPRSFGSTNATTYSPNDASGDVNDLASINTDVGFPFVGTNFFAPGFLGNISYPTNSWRTLKIYGDGYSNFNASARAPDWALLDLFTVNTPGGRTPGKINVNSQRDWIVDPGNEGTFCGMLTGIPIYPGENLPTTLPSATLRTIATNIMGNAPYFHIGELGARAAVTNVSGMTMNTDERREAVVRALSNIITVRGNAFTIYSMGQSVTILQGRTNVVGEAFTQTVVERIPVTNDVGFVTGQVFRTRYQRTLSD